MKKISNKGFVLAETIVVAVFMVTIFSILFTNYFPIMANYEKREYYDDLDSKYTAFWLKYMLQDSSYDAGFKATLDSNPSGYVFFDCNKIDNVTDSYKRKACKKLVKEAGLTTNPFCNKGGCNNANYEKPTYTGDIPLKYVAIITNYRIDGFKSNLNDYNNDLYKNVSDGMIDYINSLPNYVHPSSNGAKYRLIIELYDNREEERMPIYKYSTIEVTR